MSQLVERFLGLLQPDTKSRVKQELLRVGFNSAHWARAVMYKECAARLEEIESERLDTLEVSGNIRELVPGVRFKSHRVVSYPDFDICKDRLDETFDLIIADQVFEHVLWPYRAAQNVYAMLKPGGYFMVMTPFLIRVHASPTDCTRWTAMGMKYFLAEAGFPLDDVRVNQWGNRACARANFRRWARTGWGLLHSLRNETRFPVMVWALARKPS